MANRTYRVHHLKLPTTLERGKLVMIGDKVRVSKFHLERAMDGIMGMFSWADAHRRGIVQEDWYKHYRKLEVLHSSITRGELEDSVYFDTWVADQMQRKDYEKIAASLAKSWVQYGTGTESKLAVSNVINNLCVTLKEDNPNFSREMFIARIEQLVAEDKASG